MPDTKWCGMGDTAAGYDDLGRAKATDRCCRDHDHCPVSLIAGQSRGGATNNGRFTRSACECDTKFFNCLVEANTAHSQLVGELYFNILSPDCVKDVTPRYARRKGSGQKQEPEERLKLVKSPLAGQFPEPPNEEDMQEEAEDLVLRAWTELIQGR